jgi:hypothetical protein
MVKQTVIIAAVILFSFTASSQNKKDTIATDQTPILSIKDVSVIDSVLQKRINKFELADYNQILSYLREIINLRVREYNIANKPSPAKKP